MKRNLTFAAILVCMLLNLAGCMPLKVSTDAQDTDFSSIHTELVSEEDFTIQPDVRLFTLYAYMNASGYDQEAVEFTAERQELRADLEEKLKSVDPAKVREWLKFYEQHRQHVYRYVYYTLALGTPPDFDLIVPQEKIEDTSIFQSLNGLNRVLSDFYTTVGLQEMYESKYRGQMMEWVRKYDTQQIAADLDEVYAYLHLNRSDVEPFDLVIIPVPYESHYTAKSINFRDRLYIVDGPGSNDEGLNVHEYLHKLLDGRIPADLGGQKGKFQAILKANQNKDQVRSSYSQVGIYVEECMVRALDYRIRLAQNPGPQTEGWTGANLKDDIDQGLVLEDDFYAVFEKFEQDPNRDLNEFIIEALQSISENQ